MCIEFLCLFKDSDWRILIRYNVLHILDKKNRKIKILEKHNILWNSEKSDEILDVEATLCCYAIEVSGQRKINKESAQWKTGKISVVLMSRGW